MFKQDMQYGQVPIWLGSKKNSKSKISKEFKRTREPVKVLGTFIRMIRMVKKIFLPKLEK